MQQKEKGIFKINDIGCRCPPFLWLVYSSPSKNVLAQLVSDRGRKGTVARIVRKAKADRVGTAIADLTVCGAVPPYNEILGGKLVAMLMVGPEVVVEYRRRFGGTPTVFPVTAYEVTPPAGRKRQRRKKP